MNMKTSKLGISVGLLGASVYFMGLFSGYFAALLLAGCILLVEENLWLRRAAVKAVAVMAFFSLLDVLIGFLPSVAGFINSICALFDGHFSLGIVSEILNVIDRLIDLCRTVVLLLLGFSALNQRTILVGPVDDLLNRHLS